MTDADYMRLAIAKAREGLANGQTPFGACIVREDQVIALAHNTVFATTDITAHAEITAIRQACGHLHSVDLSGATIYSTTEPCPMCFGAIHWARIARIVFGTAIPDAQAAGFAELPIPNAQLKDLGHANVEIVAGFLRDEARPLFDEFARRHGKAY